LTLKYGVKNTKLLITFTCLSIQLQHSLKLKKNQKKKEKIAKSYSLGGDSFVDGTFPGVYFLSDLYLVALIYLKLYQQIR